MISCSCFWDAIWTCGDVCTCGLTQRQVCAPPSPAKAVVHPTSTRRCKWMCTKTSWVRSSWPVYQPLVLQGAAVPLSTYICQVYSEVCGCCARWLMVRLRSPTDWVGYRPSSSCHTLRMAVTVLASVLV
jgi:hypothetical protein